MTASRRSKGGTFAHGEHDRGGPYLGDTLALAEAFEALAAVEPAGPWRARASEALAAIDMRFRGAAGYLSTAGRPTRLVEENVAVARLAARLARPDIGDHAMRFLTSPTLLEVRPLSPLVLLADWERRL